MFSSYLKASIKSVTSISAMLPTLIIFENPVSSWKLQSIIPVRRAPDWEIKAILPGFGMLSAKEALKLTGTVEIIPRQFGPTIRTSNFFAVSKSNLSARAPSGPISLKPALMTIAHLTPTSPASSTTVCTNSAGTQTTARSILSSDSFMEGMDFKPKISSGFGLTGHK